MKVIEDGKRYECHTAQGVPVFDVIFCRSVDGAFQDGITNEELINILIHRMTFLVKQKPSSENINSLTHLRQAKEFLTARNFGKLIKSKNLNIIPNDDRRNGLLAHAEGGQAKQQKLGEHKDTCDHIPAQ